MENKTYKIIAIIAAAAAVIGLVSFVGGVKQVNIGAFVFPAIIATWSFSAYLRGQKKK